MLQKIGTRTQSCPHLTDFSGGQQLAQLSIATLRTSGGGGGKGEATERGQRTRKIGNQGDIKLGKREGFILLVNLPPVHQLLLTH